MTLKHRFDLAALAKAKTKRSSVEFRPIGARLSFEESLYRIVSKTVGDIAKQRGALLRAAAIDRSRLTGDAFGIADIVGALRSVFTQAATMARGPLDSLFRGEARRHDETWMQQVNRVIGVDLKAVIRSTDVEPAITLAVQENVALIRGLGEDVAKRLEVQILNAVSEGKSGKAISQIVTETTGFAKNRAKLIAVDQASKFNGVLNQIRQEQAGITRYTWSTVRDARVRPLHREREGQTFRWDSPPSDGHPGRAPRCRCVARAVLDFEPEKVSRSERARARRVGTAAVAQALGLNL